MLVHRTWRGVAGAALLAVGACGEQLPVKPRETVTTSVATASDGCGASFTAVTTEQDSVLQAYGYPPTSDTVFVCETWTGSDYAVRTQLVGSSEFQRNVRDTVRTVNYQGGVVTGYDSLGAMTGGGAGLLVGTNSPTPTVFSFIGADSATVQASYDAPYYAISSPPSGTSIAPVAATSPGHSQSVPPSFARHGLTRRGVRALLDPLLEIDRSAEGNRRFVKTLNGEETIYSVDSASELLVGEETKTANGDRIRTAHTWRRGVSGWVRAKSETVNEELVNGVLFKSYSVTTIANVQILGVAQ